MKRGAKPPKDRSIETIRGVAIILVIGLHLTNDAALAGGRNPYEFLAAAFQNVRMPLFTVVSGYLYAVRPVTREIGSFLSGKARRILLPLVVASTLEYLATSLAPGINNPTDLAQIWRIYILPYETYWFLQAIMLVFVTVASLDYFGRINSFRSWVFVSVAAFVLPVAVRWGMPFPPDIFSLVGATYLLPYFLLGLGIRRYGPQLEQRLSNGRLLATFVLIVALEQTAYWWPAFPLSVERASALGMFVGAVWCVGAFRARFSWWPLAALGGFAYPIYLYQSFGAGLGRRLVADFEGHLYFVSVLAITLAFGVCWGAIAERTPIVRVLALGLRPRKNGAPRSD